MQRRYPRWMALAFCATVGLQASGHAQTAVPTTQRFDAGATLNRYCVTCHNEKLKTANLLLEKMDSANVGPEAEIWEKVVRKVRSGQMPPAGAPRPDPITLSSLAN